MNKVFRIIIPILVIIDLLLMPEAMQLANLSKTRFYDYVTEGFIVPYKEEGTKTMYRRGDCLTAQVRRKELVN